MGRCDAAHSRDLWSRLVFLARFGGRSVFNGIRQFIAGDGDVVLVELVMTQTRDLVMWRHQMNIGDQQHIDLKPGLDGKDVGALLVEQESCHIYRNLSMNCAGVFLHCIFLDDAQDMQSGGFNPANEAGAAATRTGLVAGFAQRRLQTLARQFHQAEFGNLAELHARTIVVQ